MKEKVVLVVRILFGLMFVNAGLNKFLQYMPMPEMSEQGMALMEAFGDTAYMFPLIAITELLAGLMIISKKCTALGAVLLMPVTVNIFLFHAFLDPAGLVMAIVLLGINIYLLYSQKSRLCSVCGCDAAKCC